MHPSLASWLAGTYGGPTEAQRRTVPLVEAGDHVLLSSPTGSGKTLAAFLGILSRLAEGPLEDRTYCVYVSPLKALVNDMARNLAAPIEGAGLGVRVAVRTGDTPGHVRARQAARPPHILITTPESLALLLASPKARGNLLGVRHVVVDEIHSIAESKRGAQLMLALERLAAYVGEFQRIGLSATVRPLDEVAQFLGGDRPVEVVEVAPKGEPDLEVVMPVADPLKVSDGVVSGATLALVEREMERSRTLLVFTNTRAGAERLARELDERHPREDGVGEREVELVLPHHGSLSRETRLDVEERLKHGRVRCVVASSSLELGIHTDHVERVILLGSPKGAARTLQRMGRSGHSPGSTARATLVVEDPYDMPEAHALQRLARARQVEDVRIPEAPLDVLMQHLIAMRFELPLGPDDAFRITRRAHSYRMLTRASFDECHAQLPRLARFEYLQNAGTIPETGVLKVFQGETFVGEVDEEFAARLVEGDLFLLAGRTWRFLAAGLARIHVEPARRHLADAPRWKGEGLGATRLLMDTTLDILSNGSSVYPWMQLQEAWAGSPVGRALVESYRQGVRRAIVFHTYLGRRANEALALALPWGPLVDATATDAGFALLVDPSWKPSRGKVLDLLRAPIEPRLRAALAGSELLERRFRHVLMRALVIRKAPGERLGRRQRRANALLDRLPPEHPLVREAMGECLRDAMDVDAAESWRARVVDGELPLRLVDTRPCGSPLAARILAPGGELRLAALRDNLDAIDMYDSMLSRR